MTRPTIAEIVLPALRHNLSLIRSRAREAGGEGVELIPVVKADAYGHGALGVSRELIRQGVKWLAVACLEEALELAEFGDRAGIIILGPMRREEAAEVLARGFIPVLSSRDDLGLLETALKSAVPPKPPRVILDFDTGMGRMGLMSEELREVCDRLRPLPVRVTGLFSHLPAAESGLPGDLEYTDRQIQDFQLLARSLGQAFPGLQLVSLANSAGLFFHPSSVFSAVRPGISLYGVRPDADLPGPEGLRPVMRWISEIVQVRSLPEGASISYGRKTRLSRRSLIKRILYQTNPTFTSPRHSHARFPHSGDAEGRAEIQRRCYSRSRADAVTSLTFRPVSGNVDDRSNKAR